MKSIEGLSQDQPARAISTPEVYEKVRNVISTLNSWLENETVHFTVVLDDPAGNSYIENPCAPAHDPKMTIKHYNRTPEQNLAIGLNETEPISQEITDEDLREEVFSFPSNCSSCNVPCDTKMKVMNIPYFKDVVIMSTCCDSCGYKSNEVKAGGAIAEKGTRITLKMTDVEDLSRDILKSESCGLKIPELELELDHGTLGGRFTTIEGLLQNVYDELESRVPFSRGDSTEIEQKHRFASFLERLNKVNRF